MSRCLTGSELTRAECGTRRRFQSQLIRDALWRKGINSRQIARELGVSDEAVSATILGKNHSERVLDALRSAGVPERYLFDPRRTSPAGKEVAA